MSSSTSVSAQTTPKQADVIVVGAGLSGLRAALEVQATGLSCIVVEAIDRVGGKTLTVPSKQSGPGVNDIGGAWINDTSQTEMYKLLQKYGLHGEVQRAEGMCLLQIPEGIIAHPHDSLPFEDKDQVLVGSALQHLREVIERINLENPESVNTAKQLDSITPTEYCNKTFQSELVTGLIDTAIQSMLGVEGTEISMLGFLLGMKAATGIDAAMSDGKDGAQYLRLREGTQTFSIKMAEELKPDSLVLSAPVTSIEQCPQTRTCTVRTSSPGHSTLQAKKVILSIPSTLYNKITFNPSLSAAKSRLANENTIGYYSKMIYVFDKPWWHTAGLSGAIQTSSGPIVFSRDTSVPADDQWSITCFLVADRGREWSLLSQDERRRTAWEQFRTIFEGAAGPSEKLDVPEPINVLEMEWSKEEFFGGAPCPVSPPGLISSLGDSAGCTPLDNIHFVGTETASVWTGYMEGAVRSGDRGAQEVIDALKKSSS